MGSRQPDGTPNVVLALGMTPLPLLLRPLLLRLALLVQMNYSLILPALADICEQ